MQYLLDLINPPAPVEPSALEQVQQYVEENPEQALYAMGSAVAIASLYTAKKMYDRAVQPIVITDPVAEVPAPAPVKSALELALEISELSDDHKAALKNSDADESEKLELVNLLKKKYSRKAPFIRYIIGLPRFNAEQAIEKAIAIMKQQNDSVYTVKP